MKFRILVVVSVIAMANTLLLAGASGAHANTLCKHYDSYAVGDITIGLTHKAGTLCAAPASDYRNYQGWLGIVTDGNPISTQPNPCGWTLFGYDIDDPLPPVMCDNFIDKKIPSWSWNENRGWVSDLSTANVENNRSIYLGAKVYVYPFTNEWRWIYAKDQSGHYDWHAIEAKYVALQWFTPREVIVF